MAISKRSPEATNQGQISMIFKIFSWTNEGKKVFLIQNRYGYFMPKLTICIFTYAIGFEEKNAYFSPK
jgi:hypothetical protein